MSKVTIEIPSLFFNLKCHVKIDDEGWKALKEYKVDENWRQIKDNHYYEVSKDGTVRNFYTKRCLEPIIMNARKYVFLRDDGKKKRVAVEDLVDQAFLPNPENQTKA